VKNEKPTRHRLLKAPREGKFASSKDFVSGLQFTVFVILLVESGQQLLGNLQEGNANLVQPGVSPGPQPRGADNILHNAFAQTMYPLAATSAFWCSPAWRFSLPQPVSA